MKTVTIQNVDALRMLANDPNIKSIENFACEPNGHKFKVGDICEIHGMEQLTEFNGIKVEIANIRQDGECGKCYYIKGDCNPTINWTYEYRLK